jgi:nucleoside-diphosphate-sugar epimerase
MYQDKRVLLIGGGGTLGTYTAEELLRLGATVEIICPEEKISDNERLIFHRDYVSEALLKKLFSEKHYDGIVNFIHYEEIEDYKRVHPLLIENTDHLIFLSSYRVYANEQHPITESAPRLLEVIKDEDFLANEKYALPKARCEDLLRSEHRGEPWTIVRPVISFSASRMDLLMYSGDKILKAAKAGRALPLPETVKHFHAGLDWAGNSGKLIANLLFKKEALGETYTVYSGHGMRWGEIASIYERITGAKFIWCSEEEYFASEDGRLKSKAQEWQWKHDRAYDRDPDASKILKATHLKKEDFATVEYGIKQELKKLNFKT